MHKTEHANMLNKIECATWMGLNILKWYPNKIEHSKMGLKSRTGNVNYFRREHWYQHDSVKPSQNTKNNSLFSQIDILIKSPKLKYKTTHLHLLKQLVKTKTTSYKIKSRETLPTRATMANLNSEPYDSLSLALHRVDGEITIGDQPSVLQVPSTTVCTTVLKCKNRCTVPTK